MLKKCGKVLFLIVKNGIYTSYNVENVLSCGGRCSCRNWPILRVDDVVVRCARPPSMGVIGQLEGPPTAEVCFPQGYPGTGTCVEKDSRNVRMGEPQNLTSPINEFCISYDIPFESARRGKMRKHTFRKKYWKKWGAYKFLPRGPWGTGRRFFFEKSKNLWNMLSLVVGAVVAGIGPYFVWMMS